MSMINSKYIMAEEKKIDTALKMSRPQVALDYLGLVFEHLNSKPLQGTDRLIPLAFNIKKFNALLQLKQYNAAINTIMLAEKKSIPGRLKGQQKLKFTTFFRNRLIAPLLQAMPVLKDSKSHSQTIELANFSLRLLEKFGSQSHGDLYKGHFYSYLSHAADKLKQPKLARLARQTALEYYNPNLVIQLVKEEPLYFRKIALLKDAISKFGKFESSGKKIFGLSYLNLMYELSYIYFSSGEHEKATDTINTALTTYPFNEKERSTIEIEKLARLHYYRCLYLCYTTRCESSKGKANFEVKPTHINYYKESSKFIAQFASQDCKQSLQEYENQLCLNIPTNNKRIKGCIPLLFMSTQPTQDLVGRLFEQIHQASKEKILDQPLNRIIQHYLLKHKDFILNSEWAIDDDYSFISSRNTQNHNNLTVRLRKNQQLMMRIAFAQKRHGANRKDLDEIKATLDTMTTVIKQAKGSTFYSPSQFVIACSFFSIYPYHKTISNSLKHALAELEQLKEDDARFNLLLAFYRCSLGLNEADLKRFVYPALEKFMFPNAISTLETLNLEPLLLYCLALSQFTTKNEVTYKQFIRHYTPVIHHMLIRAVHKVEQYDATGKNQLRMAINYFQCEQAKSSLSAHEKKHPYTPVGNPSATQNAVCRVLNEYFKTASYITIESEKNVNGLPVDIFITTQNRRKKPVICIIDVKGKTHFKDCDPGVKKVIRTPKDNFVKHLVLNSFDKTVIYIELRCDDKMPNLGNRNDFRSYIIKEVGAKIPTLKPMDHNTIEDEKNTHSVGTKTPLTRITSNQSDDATSQSSKLKPVAKKLSLKFERIKKRFSKNLTRLGIRELNNFIIELENNPQFPKLYKDAVTLRDKIAMRPTFDKATRKAVSHKTIRP